MNKFFPFSLLPIHRKVPNLCGRSSSASSSPAKMSPSAAMRSFLALTVLSVTPLVCASPVSNSRNQPFMLFFSFPPPGIDNRLMTLPMNNPGVPNHEQRQVYSDRLWLSDHDEPPKASFRTYAISNDNGTTPAYWRHRVNTNALPPSDVERSAALDEKHDSKLSPRLPFFVTVYSDDECEGFLTDIPNPQNGRCYGAWDLADAASIEIPSSNTGDIFNFYHDRSCQDYNWQLFHFVGCFSFSYRGVVKSFWPCNICG